MDLQWNQKQEICYISMQKQQHVNLSVKRNCFSYQSWLSISRSITDRIIPCNCHDQRFLEIKCPSKYEYGFLNWENDKTKRLHVKMFLLWTSLFIHPTNNSTVSLTTVKSNKDFVEKTNVKSWRYSENISLPELVTHRLDNILENNRKIYGFCRKSSFGNVIECDNSKYKFEWFHYSYINITQASKEKWYCKECKDGENKI